MRLIYLFALLSICFVVGCSRLEKPKISSLKLQNQVNGVWQRTIIANKQYVTLTYFIYDNQHFSLKTDTFNFSTPPPRIGQSTGTWDIYTDSVLIFSSDGNQNKFYFDGKILREIEKGKIIASSQDSLFQFKKVRLKPNLAHHTSNGTHIVAYGSMPRYWSLKLDSLNNLWFYVEAHIKSFPLFAKTSILKLNETEFAIENKSEQFEMFVKGVRQNIQDTVYSMNFPWKVSVEYNENGQIVIYKGGGIVLK